MKASNDSNSLLMVTRSPDRFSESSIGVPLLAREIELLEMVLGSRRDLDSSHISTLGLLEPGSTAAREKVGHRRMASHQNRVARQSFSATANLAEDFVSDRFLGLQVPRAVAVETWLVQKPAEALSRALSRHLDQAKLGDSVQRRFGFVALQQLIERLSNRLSVRGLLHVD